MLPWTIFFKRILFLIPLVLFSNVLLADNFSWKNNAASSSWEDPLNWSGTTAVPVNGSNQVVFRSTDNITIVSSTNAPVLSSNQTIGAFTVSSGSVVINSIINVNGTLTISNGTLVDGTGQIFAGPITPIVASIGGTSSAGPTINCSFAGNIGPLNLRNSIFGSNATVSLKIYNGTGYFNIGGNTFNGPTTFESAGSQGVRLSDLGEDKFNNDLTLIATSGAVYTSYNYNTTYNGNIVVKSTGTSLGVYFGNPAANSLITSKLAINKTIKAEDFTSGTLTLKNFIQQGASTPHIFNLGGTASMNIASGTGVTSPLSVFDSPITVTAFTIGLNGANFKEDVSFSASFTSSSSGVNIYQKKSYFNFNTTQNISWTFNGNDQYLGEATFVNSNTGILYVGNGNATFGDNAIFDYKGSYSQIVLANSNLATVNFNNPAAKAKFIVRGAGGVIKMAENGTTNFNCNVEVNSTAGANIYSVGGNGHVNLKEGRTISVGDLGFSSGLLSLKNFIQEGTTPQTLSLPCSGTATLYLQAGSVYNGNLTVQAPSLYVNGGIYWGIADFTMCNTGAANVYSVNTEPVVFKNDVNIRNTGSSFLFLGAGTPQVSFEGNSNFYLTGAGSIILAYATGNTTQFTNSTKKASFVISNVASQGINIGMNGNCILNCNVEVSNSSSSMVRFGYASGLTTLKEGFTITAPVGTFTSGYLYFKNFLQEGNTPQNINLSGNAIAYFTSTPKFYGTINVISPGIELGGGVFYNTSYFEKTGSNNSAGAGGNKFIGSATFKNSGAGYLYLGNTTSDEFNDVSFINTSTGGIYASVNGSNNLYNGNIYVESTGAGGVTIGAGISKLASGKIITVGTFSAGNFYLKNFTQLGAELQTFNLTGSSTFAVLQSTFNGPLNIEAPNLNFQASTFEKPVTLIKTGSVNNTINGGNVFKDDVVISTTSSGGASMGGDIFKKKATFIKGGIGVLKPVQVGTGEFYGDIVYDVTSPGQIPDYFGWMGGLCIFKGDASQSISSNKGSLTFTNVKIDKSLNDVKLNCNFQVNNGSVSFVKGNFIADPINYFGVIFNNNITGTSDQSHVEGLVRRYGQGAFTFPIGKNGKYMPISISAPAANEDIRAEAFLAAPPNATTVNNTLSRISSCQYWDVQKVAGFTNLSLTIPWTSSTCEGTNTRDVSVAQYKNNVWQFFGANNKIVDVTSGSITSNAPFTSGYYTLGYIPFDESIFGILATKVDGSFYPVKGQKINFRFLDQYKDAGSLKYKIYSNPAELKGSGTISTIYGQNYESIELQTLGLIDGKLYILEVTDEKNRKSYLKFEYKNN